VENERWGGIDRVRVDVLRNGIAHQWLQKFIEKLHFKSGKHFSSRLKGIHFQRDYEPRTIPPGGTSSRIRLERKTNQADIFKLNFRVLGSKDTAPSETKDRSTKVILPLLSINMIEDECVP